MARKAGEVYVDVKTRGVKQAQNSIRAFASSAGALLGAIGAGVAFQKILQFSKDILQAADKQIQAETVLAQTLRATGQYSDDVYQSFLKSAQAIQSMTTYGDEELLPVMAQFARLGNLSADEIERATKLTTDLAAATGRDLRAAQQLVFYALQGNVGMLRRAGIELDKNIVKSGDISKIMGEIESKVGGTAQAVAQTFGGALKQIQNMIGDIKEQFGKAFMQSPAVQRSMEYIVEVFRYLGEFFESEAGIEWVESLANGFERLLKSVLPTVKALSDISLTMAPMLALTPGIHGILALMGTNFKEWYKNLKATNQALGDLTEHMEQFGSGWQGWKREMAKPPQGAQVPTPIPPGALTPAVGAGGAAETAEAKASWQYLWEQTWQYLEAQEKLRGQALETAKAIAIQNARTRFNAFISAEAAESVNIYAEALKSLSGQALNAATSLARMAGAGKLSLGDISSQIGGLLAQFGMATGNPLLAVGTAFGAGLLERIFNPEAYKMDVNFNQNITINIGEGQISERAFWDDLVMRHLVPSLERGGVSPVPEGGAG